MAVSAVMFFKLFRSYVMSEAILVSVKWFKQAKGFGFFTHTDGKDIFVHIEHLERFGFNSSDMIEGAPALVEYETSEKGKTVTAISRIGDKLAEPVVEKSAVAKKKGVAGKSPKLTASMFNAHQIAHQTEGDHFGEAILRVTTPDGDFVQYIVVLGHEVIRQLGNVSLEEARADIGKVATPPILYSYDDKTNVTPLFTSRRKSTPKLATHAS
jgi:cold shock CspA family protein